MVSINEIREIYLRGPRGQSNLRLPISKSVAIGCVPGGDHSIAAKQLLRSPHPPGAFNDVWMIAPLGEKGELAAMDYYLMIYGGSISPNPPPRRPPLQKGSLTGAMGNRLIVLLPFGCNLIDLVVRSPIPGCPRRKGYPRGERERYHTSDGLRQHMWGILTRSPHSREKNCSSHC